jgi:DHA2 family multidrug resistance protein
MSNTAALDRLRPPAPGASVPAATASLPTPALEEVSFKTWVAVIGSTIGAFLAILNIQVVGASLADIQGGIGAGIDDGGWITTSSRR